MQIVCPDRRWLRVGGELGLLLALYGVYLAGRAAIGVQVQDATARGLEILHLEAALHVNIEGPLNQLVTALPALGLTFAYLYATLHYLITPLVLGWVAWRHRHGYNRARTAMIIMTLTGLTLYALLPTAPPRLLDTGLVDTLAHFSGSGWWGDAASAPKGFEGLSNQYAAMPSLHVGWALWCALCLHQHARRPLLRKLAWGYPILMSLIVIGTANHYLLDVVGGVACAALGWWTAGRLERARTTRHRRHQPAVRPTRTRQPSCPRTPARTHPVTHHATRNG